MIKYILIIPLFFSLILYSNTKDKWYEGKIIKDGVEEYGWIVYYFQTDGVEFKLKSGEIRTFGASTLDGFEYTDAKNKLRRFISLAYSYSNNYQAQGFFEIIWESPYMAILGKKDKEYIQQNTYFGTSETVPAGLPKKAENRTRLKLQYVYIVDEEKNIKPYLEYFSRREIDAYKVGVIMNSKLLKETTKDKYPAIQELGKKKRFKFDCVRQLELAFELYSNLRDKELGITK